MGGGCCSTPVGDIVDRPESSEPGDDSGRGVELRQRRAEIDGRIEQLRR
jgi:hypothetical protein